MPRAVATSLIDIGWRASRRRARIRPKLSPSASDTSRRRSLSSTRSHRADHTLSGVGGRPTSTRLP